MVFNPLELPPLLTADLPGIDGLIKQQPEDFEVEEIPAYPPCGSGPFLYLWVEKRDMGAEYFLRQVARRLGLATGDIGTAGLKDRHAITRQMVSVPENVAKSLDQLNGDGIRLLGHSRHTNKLRSGHLHGNRFRILVRNVHPEAAARLDPLLARLKQLGMPNYFGPQRFGREQETGLLGLAMLKKEPLPLSSTGRIPNVRSAFLRKLALSAAQAALFNVYLARRQAEGLLGEVLDGDVMSKWPAGGMFVAEDLEREQARFEARETVHTGPIYGRKTFPAHGQAADREAAVLADAGLTTASFAGFGKLVQGTRRHNLVYLVDLMAAPEQDGVRFTFTLPAGSYATVLLREITRSQELPVGEEE